MPLFQIPEKLVNFEVYSDALNLIGLTDAELPTFEHLTEKVSGAGILGEYDGIAIGHVGSLKLKLNWRMLTPQGLALLAPVTHTLILMGSGQVREQLSGAITTVAIRVEVTGTVNTTALGKLTPAKPMEASHEVEATAIRIFFDGAPVVMFDRLNYRFLVNGVDYLAKVRADLGRA